MGYTNYWDQTKSFTDKEWKKVKDEYEYIKEICEDIIIDQTKESDEIVFNGIKDLSHETFYINKQNNKKSFNFCKTARKPYDLAVWHLLYFINKETKALNEISRDR